MTTNGEKLSQQGQSCVDEALLKLLEKIPDKPTRIAVQEMAVRQGKKDKEFGERLDRLTLFCDEMNLRLREQEKYTSKDSVTIRNPPLDPKIQGQ